MVNTPRQIIATPFKVRDIRTATRTNVKIKRLIRTAEENRQRIKVNEIRDSLKFRGFPKSSRPGGIE